MFYLICKYFRQTILESINWIKSFPGLQYTKDTRYKLASSAGFEPAASGTNWHPQPEILEAQERTKGIAQADQIW